jgi:hypothetical protein
VARANEQAIDLPGSIIKSIRGSAEKIRETFSEEPSEWLIIEDAADKIGVPIWRIREWRRAGFIPFRKFGWRLEFKISVCDEIRELREEHGDQWPKFVSWTNEPGPMLKITPSEWAAQTISKNLSPKEPSEPGDGVDQSESIAARIMARAKERYAAGDYAGSAALFVAAIEDCELVGDE